MSSLPHDIIVDILSRLPVKSLTRFRCVSKPWRCLITSPDFVKKHLNHAIQNDYLNLMLRYSFLYSMQFDSFDEAIEIDYPLKTPNGGVEILGSCNGLVCIINIDDVICIWNPSTKEFKQLPTPTIVFPENSFGCRTMMYGFGYDPTIDDYKVVRIVCFDYGVDTEVKVYTLGTNTWRRIQDIPYYLFYKKVSGVLVNGALHWLAACDPESEVPDTIVALDLATEELKVVPQPDYPNEGFHMNVSVLGGNLAIICNFYQIRVEIWSMTGYGVKDSWVKILNISQPDVLPSFEYLLPLWFSKTGEILLVKDNEELVMFDPDCQKVRAVTIHGIPKWFEAEAYVRSLVSIKSGTYVGQEVVKRKGKHKKKKSAKMKYDDDWAFGF